MTRGVKGPAVHRRCRQCKEWFMVKGYKQKFCTLSCSAQYRNAQPAWRKAHSKKIKAITDPAVMRERARALWRDPRVRAVITESVRKRTNSKEHLTWMAEHNKQLWANKEYRKQHVKRNSERVTKQWQDPKYREAMSVQMTKENKKRWADPEFKERTSRNIRIGKLAPLVKKREIAIARERADRPETRERMSRLMKERWNDPEMRAKMSANSAATARRNWDSNPAYRKRLAKAAAAWARSPENRARMAALNRSRAKRKRITDNERPKP